MTDEASYPVCTICGGRIFWNRVDQEWFHRSDPPRTLYPLHAPEPPDYEQPGNLRPGFQVSAEDLSDEQAIQAMQDTARSMQEVALAERRTLLSLGFADNHSLCLELDKTVKEYVDAFEVLRRQSAPATERTGA